MRNSALIAAVLFVLVLVATPAAKAGTVSLTIHQVTPSTTTFVISGTYAAGVPTTSISAPGDSYAFSFTVLTNVSKSSSFRYSPNDIVNGGNLGGFFTVNSHFSLSLDGGTGMNLGTILVEFDDLAGGNEGGLIFCLNAPQDACNSNTYWDIIGQQLFKGPLAHPNFRLPGLHGHGTMNARVNEAASGYIIDNVGPFPFGSSSTPEPASMLLLGTGLIGIGAFGRRKFLRS